MNSLFSELYTIEGRIGRISYLWKMLRLLIAGFAFLFVAALGAPLLRDLVGDFYFNIIMTVYYLFVASLFVFPPIALQIRRLHDIGYSGWLVWIPTLLCGLLGLVLGYAMGLQEAIDTITKAAGGISLVFILFLLIWPGEEGTNKYGVGSGAYHTNLNNSQRQKMLRTPSARKTYEVILRDPMPEDSLYIFSHLRQQNRDIQKIQLPETRDQVSFVIIGNSTLTERSIKKMLHDLGILTKRVKKKRN